MTFENEFRVYSTEDNPAHQELLRVAFSRTNADVQMVFYDSAECLLAKIAAVSEAQTHRAWLPDLFLVDVSLPGISGCDLVRQLRANALVSHAPIVMLSSSAAHRDREEAFRNGADDYFTKPTSLGELIVMVSNIVSDWHNAKIAEANEPEESRTEARQHCQPYSLVAGRSTFERISDAVSPQMYHRVTLH